jgi:hypothetical protein
MDYLEEQSRRNNMAVVGIPESTHESEEKVRKISL